jgi:DNA-binding response OmpR family regulator
VSARLLLVEDDRGIAEAIQYALQAESFETDVAGSGEEALERVDETRYDVVILDLMLPGISGLEVCRRIRQASALPILMLTARTAEVDVVLGLEAGADDYVQKPFSMPELVSRVRAILRRRELDRRDEGDVRQVGGIKLDLRRHSATVDGRPVDLTLSELKLLVLLTDEPGRAYSRRELMERLWDSPHVGDQRACDTHITNLRRKVERDPSRPERILTVRGVGYKLAVM